METENKYLLPSRAAWAIQPEALAAIDARTLTHLQAEQASRIGAALTTDDFTPTESKVAVISLTGVITPNGSALMRLLGLGGGGLNSFRRALAHYTADEEVSAIVLNIDSPGGLVSLVPETAAEIRAARESKPVIAVANVMAGSAAYYLASQASELVVTTSGEVGSVGVLWRHEDFSQMIAKDGVKVTLIHAGKYKTEGNPFEPLSDSAREHFQSTVDDFYDMFVADVAAGRGVRESAVREGFGEGRMVLAEEAVKAGMADRVATLEETIASLGAGDEPTGVEARAVTSKPLVDAAVASDKLAPAAAERAEATATEPTPAEPEQRVETEEPAKPAELSEEDRKRLAAVLLA